MTGAGKIAALAAMSIGVSMGGSSSVLPSYPSRRDWSHIKHIPSEKPLSKRRKRRLRGKAKATRP